MPFTLYESGAKAKEETKSGATAIASGTVTNNCDLVMQGKVLVRIPSKGLEVWARLTAVGAGQGRGFLFNPQIGDEVLVAFNQEDPTDAFVIGGLWSDLDRVPALAPTDPLTKRVIKTGVAGGLGHELEFDDLLQSVTITTTLGQTIKLSPAGIQILSGTNVINMAPPMAPSGAITIVVGAGADANTISLSPAGITIAGTKAINLTAPSINIVATGTCNIKGGTVAIN